MPRWLQWEFLPWQFFYIPVYFYYLILSARAGSLAWVSAVNPQIPLGGLADTSKYSLLRYFPAEFLPATLLIQSAQEWLVVKSMMEERNLKFPLIVKPDRMERGRGVALLNEWSELMSYHSKSNFDFLIQEYVDFPLELGIMYHRLPGASSGSISSVVQKGFLKIYGDGKSSFLQLVYAHPRASYYRSRIVKTWKHKLEYVPGDGEEILLEPIGNHNRGTTFHNANHLIDEALCEFFDKLSAHVPDFYFGRFDIRVKSLEDLRAGRNIKIIELNGSNSEPAHIYDPSARLTDAYKVLFRHWRIMLEIALINHRSNGVKFETAGNMIRIMRRAEKNRQALEV